MAKIRANHTGRSMVLNGMIEEINSLEELMAIQEAVSAHFKRLTAEIAAKFSIGEEVGFMAGRRGYKQGKITSIAATSCKVQVGSTQWTVDAALLSKVATLEIKGTVTPLAGNGQG